MGLRYDYAQGAWWMAALALQFGFQPIVIQRFSSDYASADPFVNPRIMVILTEGMKVCFSLFGLALNGNLHLLKTCSWDTSVIPAGIPAISYSLQNVCIYMSYLTLNPMIVNLLNPTKIAFTVVFSYFIMGRKSNLMEGIPLGLLFLVIYLLQVEEQAKKERTGGGVTNGNVNTVTNGELDRDGNTYTAILSAHGFAYGILGAILSGYGSAMSEKAMQTYIRKAESKKAKSAIDGTANGVTTNATTNGITTNGDTTTSKDTSVSQLKDPDSTVGVTKNAFLYSFELSVFTGCLTILQIIVAHYGYYLGFRDLLMEISENVNLQWQLEPNFLKVQGATFVHITPFVSCILQAITDWSSKNIVNLRIVESWLNSPPLFAVNAPALFSIEKNLPCLIALVPLLMQATGGIFVGQITKCVGGVAKGFAIIVGIVITAIVQSGEVTYKMWTAAILVALSLILQAKAQMMSNALGRDATRIHSKELETKKGK